MSTRRHKVAELVKRNVATIIQQDIRAPKGTMISVTRVDMSPDLKHAKVFISILGNARGSAKSLLEQKKGFIRKTLAKMVALRYTPALMFIIDDSIEYGMHIGGILNKIKEDEHWEEDETKGEDLTDRFASTDDYPDTNE